LARNAERTVILNLGWKAGRKGKCKEGDKTCSFAAVQKVNHKMVAVNPKGRGIMKVHHHIKIVDDI